MHMQFYQKARRSFWASGLLLLVLAGIAGCVSYDEFNNTKDISVKQAEPSSMQSPCYGSLHSNCGDTQEAFLQALFKNLEIYGLSKTSRYIPAEAAQVWKVLPKDKFGGINWTKAAVEGLIKPRNSLYEDDAENPSGQVKSRDDLTNLAGVTLRYSEQFQKLIVIQSKNHFMADVLFPHGMHTYWAACNSCHPKPFATVVGGTVMTMKDIRGGEFCGKCHGKVSFPLEPIDNCRRCHVLPKNLG